MNDDFKGLATEMGLTEPPKTEPAPTPAPATEPPTTPVTPEPTKPVEPAAPTAPTEPTPTEPVKPNPSMTNREMAEARVQNKKYKDAITAAAKAANMSEDEYLAKIQEDALAKRATDQNVPPEILRRLEAAEQELAATREKQAQEHLGRQFAGIQSKYKLSDADLTQFVQALADQGHDFQNTRADYELLYRGMYHEKLVEADRQAWLADANRARQQASNPNPVRGAGSPEPHKMETLEDLDAILANMK